jgi:hypothetical protein
MCRPIQPLLLAAVCLSSQCQFRRLLQVAFLNERLFSNRILLHLLLKQIMHFLHLHHLKAAARDPRHGVDRNEPNLCLVFQLLPQDLEINRHRLTQSPLSKQELGTGCNRVIRIRAAEILAAQTGVRILHQHAEPHQQEQ